MTAEEMLQKLLDLELAKVEAAQKAQEDEAKKAEEAKFVTKEDLQGALDSLGQQIANAIAEEVAKAMPVVRPEGAGRQGESQEQEDPFQADPIAHVVKKARGERTPEEKAFIWELTKKHGLRPEEMSIGS